MQPGRRRHVAHEIRIDVEPADAVELARGIGLSGRGRDRRQRFAHRPALAVHQIEFHLHGHHRPEPALGKARQQRRQDLARIDQAGLVLLLRHGEEKLCGRFRRPGDGRQRAGNRPGIAVGIAARFRPAAGIEILTRHVEEIEAERQLHAAIPDLRRLMRRKALAARNAVHIGEERVELRHLRMGFQEAGELPLPLPPAIPLWRPPYVPPLDVLWRAMASLSSLTGRHATEGGGTRQAARIG